jgi:hypothetical protein
MIILCFKRFVLKKRTTKLLKKCETTNGVAVIRYGKACEIFIKNGLKRKSGIR